MVYNQDVKSKKKQKNKKTTEMRLKMTKTKGRNGLLKLASMQQPSWFIGINGGWEKYGRSSCLSGQDVLWLSQLWVGGRWSRRRGSCTEGKEGERVLPAIAWSFDLAAVQLL